MDTAISDAFAAAGVLFVVVATLLWVLERGRQQFGRNAEIALMVFGLCLEVAAFVFSQSGSHEARLQSMIQTSQGQVVTSGLNLHILQGEQPCDPEKTQDCNPPSFWDLVLGWIVCPGLFLLLLLCGGNLFRLFQKIRI